MSAAESSQTWENQSHELPTTTGLLQSPSAGFRHGLLSRCLQLPAPDACKINRSLASETPPLQHRLTELAAMPSSRRAFGSSKAPRHPPTLSLSLSLRTPGREAHPQFFYSLSLSLCYKRAATLRQVAEPGLGTGAVTAIAGRPA